MADGPTDHVAEILAEWAREDPELDTSTIAVIGRILRASRHLSRAIESELARFELNVHEFNALSALRRIGPPYELTPSELSRALLFSSGGLTKLVERLERADLVRREADGRDRRVVRVQLTALGRERQEAAMAAHVENQEALLQPLDEHERATLTDALARLLVGLEAGDALVRNNRRS